MFAAQIVEFRHVTRHVIVEIHSGDRGVAAVVVGAQRERQCATAPRLFFEGSDQRPSNTTKTAVRSDDERVQFPDPPVVLGQAANPPKQKGILQGGEGEALADDPFHLPGCRLQARPSSWMVESLDQEFGSLPENNRGLSTEIGDFQIDELLYGPLNQRCRPRSKPDCLPSPTLACDGIHLTFFRVK